MSQVNWTQLTEAVVLIRSSAFRGSSWVPEVGHPPPCLAAPRGSVSQWGKVPFRPVQHPQGLRGILSSLCCASPRLCSWGEETQHEPWKVKTTPLGSPVQSPVPVSCWLQICPCSLSGLASRRVFCCLLGRWLVKGFDRCLA